MQTVTSGTQVTETVRDRRGNILRTLQKVTNAQNEFLHYQVTDYRYLDASNSNSLSATVTDLQTHVSLPYIPHSSALWNVSNTARWNANPPANSNFVWATVTKYDSSRQVEATYRNVAADVTDLSTLRPVARFDYDKFGQPRTITNAVGDTIENGYDEETGNLLSTHKVGSHGSLNKTSFLYDRGLIWQTFDGQDRPTSRLSYSDLGHVTSTTNAQGFTQIFVPNDYGEVEETFFVQGDQIFRRCQRYSPSDIGGILTPLWQTLVVCAARFGRRLA